MFRLWLLILGLACTYFRGYSQSSETAGIQACIDSFCQARGIPGLTVSWIRKGRLYSLASGWSDPDQKVRMRPDDRMLAGSTGKTFFASMVMSLVAEGKIRLDDLISKYLGKKNWFQRIPNHDSITVRMLLNHRSGIEEYYEIGDFLQRVESDPDKNWLHEELISYVFDRKPLFPAGASFGYADTNYLLLGILLETVTGRDLYHWIGQNILGPQQLKNTIPSNRRDLEALIPGYIGSGLLKQEGKSSYNGRLIINPQFEWAGGGFLSSSVDLARWARIYYLGDWQKGIDTAAIHKGLAANTGPGHLYGLGMQIRPSPFGWSYGHGGWFPGYLTEMEYYPAQDISIALQINTDNFKQLGIHPHALVLKLMERLLSGSN